MASFMDAAHKQDEDSITYIFGSYDKNEGWHFSPYYFRLINTKRGEVTGQFISSNWFNKVYEMGIIQHYMILGIRGKIYYNKIREIMNNSLPPQTLYHSITDGEFEQGVVFKDHYIFTPEEGKKLLNDDTFKESQHKSISIIGENAVSKLIITARRFKENKLYMSLPDFTMKFDYN